MYMLCIMYICNYFIDRDHDIWPMYGTIGAGDHNAWGWRMLRIMNSTDHMMLLIYIS